MDPALQQLADRMSVLEEKVDRILELLLAREADLSKMSQHVDFVEGVYDKVQEPFHYICDRVGRMVPRLT